MFQLNQVVKIKNPNFEAQGELLSTETIKVLKNTSFTGKVTQIQDGLIYVGFIDSKDNWVTQVFKPSELEVIK